MKLLLNLLITNILLFNCYTKAQDISQHEVAITIDDLPVVSLQKDIKTHEEITKRLLSAIRASKVPATGFVIGNKLYKEGSIDSSEVNLLKLWLNNGLELGNHSYSHRSLNDTEIDFYKDDLIKCDNMLKEILSAYNKTPEFYRQPFLQFGKNKSKIMDFNKFLKVNKYRMAPVTIDNSDWIFARAYENAYLTKDSLNMKNVAEEYIPYMITKFEYYRKQSEKLFGYEIKQILLIHASRLNSDYIGNLIEKIQKSGYKIITLQEAVKDRAYQHDDNYLGNAGISWLHRWAKTEGKEKDFFDGEPTTPEFVLQLAGISEE